MIILQAIVGITIILCTILYVRHREKWYKIEKEKFNAQRKIFLDNVIFLERKKYRAKTVSIFPLFSKTIFKFWEWDITAFSNNPDLYKEVISCEKGDHCG